MTGFLQILLGVKTPWGFTVTSALKNWLYALAQVEPAYPPSFPKQQEEEVASVRYAKRKELMAGFEMFGSIRDAIKESIVLENEVLDINIEQTRRILRLLARQ